MFTTTYEFVLGKMRRVDDFGERLKRLREHLKLKQGDLARTKDLKDRRNFGRYVSKIETGDETNPSLYVIERLAKGCGLLLSEFFSQIEKNSYEMTPPVSTGRDKRASTSHEVEGAHAQARTQPEVLDELHAEYERLRADIDTAARSAIQSIRRTAAATRKRQAAAGRRRP